MRLVLVSTPEGEDKPLKYPTIFNTADVALITKLDLAAATGADMPALSRNISAVRPGIRIMHVSARTGEGMHELKNWIISQHDAKFHSQSMKAG